ncbi:MAG TPA: hypothetical protein VG944_03035, partial [Fimbriimonas sp.]|nr:hypothetical protein [Fimbriimonas sp.]
MVGPVSTIHITLEPLCAGRINPMQNGQFIEYLCDLVPSMWAEKVTDGHFLGLSPYGFTFVAEKDFKEKPWYPYGAVNRANFGYANGPGTGTKSREIEIDGKLPARAGIAQDGIAVDPADPCRFSVWLRSPAQPNMRVTFRLSDRGKRIAEWTTQAATNWVKFENRVVPSTPSTNATLSITFDRPGRLDLYATSLMPESAVGGWRRDVVAALRALNPRVIRFGGSALDLPGFGEFEWQTSIGNPDLRKPIRAWGGLQPAGAGLEEIVQLCKAVGAEPLICVRTAGKSEVDAAEEVEYFNGSVATPMGVLRANNGHPAPYGIRFWQVGNEVRGPEYESQLFKFCQAMRR